MTPLPIGQNHDPGPQLAQLANNFNAVLPGVFHPAVRDVERFPPCHAENARCFLCFLGTFHCGTAGAGFPLGQVKNRRPQLQRPHAQKGATTGLLHVVPMGGDGENVNRWCCRHRWARPCRPRRKPYPPLSPASCRAMSRRQCCRCIPAHPRRCRPCAD